MKFFDVDSDFITKKSQKGTHAAPHLPSAEEIRFVEAVTEGMEDIEKGKTRPLNADFWIEIRQTATKNAQEKISYRSLDALP